MFENVGGKLKGLAKVICWVGIIGSVIGGIAIMTQGKAMIAVGIGVAAGGALASWVGSLGLYGFGEIVENSDIRTNNAAKQELEREQEKKNA